MKKIMGILVVLFAITAIVAKAEDLVLEKAPAFKGQDQILYLTAGEKCYMVKYQNGSFPAHTNFKGLANDTGQFIVWYIIPGSDTWEKVTTDMTTAVSCKTEAPAAVGGKSTDTKPDSISNASLFSNASAPTATAEKSSDGEIIPTLSAWGKPYATISGFEDGTNFMTEKIRKQIDAAAPICSKSDYICIVVGTASTSNYNECYYEPNYSYVAQQRFHDAKKHPDAKFYSAKPTNKSKEEMDKASHFCNETVTYGRAYVAAQELKRAIGKDNKNVYPAQLPFYGNRPGSYKDNQGVVILVVQRSQVSVTDGGTTTSPIISSSAPPLQCPECKVPNIEININAPCLYSWSAKDANTWVLTFLCFKESSVTGPQPPAQPSPAMKQLRCFNLKEDLPCYLITGGILGGGLGWGISQIKTTVTGARVVDGNTVSQGGNVTTSVCGKDAEWACIAGGVGIGVFSAWVIHEVHDKYVLNHPDKKGSKVDVSIEGSPTKGGGQAGVKVKY